ncbi:MAG TPA: LysR family transcriptional regulator [Usitatibacter sp.]|nr:LysR family transcriptional regulator [Usitatibacter sp.]
MSKRDKFVDWDRLRVFHAVVEAGSFTKAGRKLQLSQSAVSRQICSLEESLTVPLFYRHARGLVLTEQGEGFFRAVQEMENQLAQGLARITESRAQAEGPLKITTTVTFGSAWLTSRISLFHQQYPDIAVSLILVDSPELDLFTRQADVAIRFAEQTNAKLIQRKLMAIHYQLFASREYVRRRGAPRSAQELDSHELIAFGDEVDAPLKNIDWILELGAEPGKVRRPALRVNSVYGMYRAVKSGLGIAALPYYILDESPDLVRVLPEVQGPSFDAYFVYPEELRWSKRVAVIRDFLLQQVAEEQGAVARVPATVEP